ncbi:hypothetical protein BDQ17DRAFT_1393304 [Cyathus striatus]|nr:hypothetical protein BDQ17DRAFT_1393304 [Cyathus striatus]
MPQIQHRPIYPELKHGRSHNKGGQDWGAEGIMAAWCTHPICYGFHSIPSSKGHNDQTKFLIDHFHAASHKKYPQLKGLNSSTAECGNLVMVHICKSVSYMGQYHATLYMKTFLCIQNHVKMQKLIGYNAVHNSS